MIPPITGGLKYEGEMEVALRLQNDPATEKWAVLHSLDIAHHRSQVAGECDFVIIIPGRGVLCVEVKGCRSLKVEDGLWYYGIKPSGEKRGPFRQAAENMHSIRNYICSRNPELSQVVFWSGVLFPYVSFSCSSPEWHDWQVIDARSFMARPVSQLFMNILDRARVVLAESRTAKWFSVRASEPDDDQLNTLIEILRPEFEIYAAPAARQKNLDKQLKEFTHEQFVALDAMQLNRRVLFNGPAGTGKTLLAIEAARRAAKKEKKTLFLCFNRLVTGWIKSQFPESGFEVLTVGTLHSFMLNVCGINPPAAADAGFWTVTLPEMCIERLLEDVQLSDRRFDVMIIDEAQDVLRPDYLDFLDLMLAGGLAAGEWKVFGDFFHQQIYSAASLSLEDFCRNRCPGTPVYTMSVNCRNTPRIAACAPVLGGLSPDYSKVLRPDDNVKPELLFYSDEEQQTEILSDLLFRFREKEKYRGSEIVVISPLSEKCSARALQPPWRDRIRPFDLKNSGGHIRYSTIHSFKGLEAPVIIVTDISEIKVSSARDLLYIAVTRALSRLVILFHESVRRDFRKILGAE